MNVFTFTVFSLSLYFHFHCILHRRPYYLVLEIILFLRNHVVLQMTTTKSHYEALIGYAEQNLHIMGLSCKKSVKQGVSE